MADHSPVQSAVPDATFFETRLAEVQDPLITVVDLGACQGSLTLPALRRGATVIALEPCLAHLATTTIKATRLESGYLIPVCAAVWREGGLLLPLYRRVVNGEAADPGQISLVHYQERVVIGWAPTVTLAEVIARVPVPEVDLLKIDIEGAEHAVLPSTPREALRRVRYIDLDDHDVSNDQMFGQRIVLRADLSGVLQRAGFERPDGAALWRRVGAVND
jgi:FkbM family methyltransferase